MTHRIIQPSKEQVRAYMAAREAARRPPPSPEEIRRQLGWRLQRPEAPLPLVQFYLIPTSYSHMAGQIAVAWLLAAMRHPIRLQAIR